MLCQSWGHWYALDDVMVSNKLTSLAGNNWIFEMTMGKALSFLTVAGLTINGALEKPRDSMISVSAAAASVIY